MKIIKALTNNHFQIVGVLAVTVLFLTALGVSHLKVISGAILLTAALHIVPVILLIAGLILWIRTKAKERARNFAGDESGKAYDFGWSTIWMNAYWISGVIFLIMAVLVYLADPVFVLLIVFLLFAALNSFAGNYVWRNSRNTDFMALPFVDLFSTDSDLILDAGCGSGRTSIALCRVMKNGRIIALDRFDSTYIEKGGLELYKRNIEIAGLQDKVQILKGDVTGIESGDNKFDTAASAYMMDHLTGRELQLQALREINRVLKKDGKFLLVVLVPGLSTFAVANVFCFTLTPRKEWRKMFQQSGFRILDQGCINGGAFFLTQKK